MENITQELDEKLVRRGRQAGIVTSATQVPNLSPLTVHQATQNNESSNARASLN
jgi:hypothetical protein